MEKITQTNILLGGNLYILIPFSSIAPETHIELEIINFQPRINVESMLEQSSSSFFTLFDVKMNHPYPNVLLLVTSKRTKLMSEN